MDPEKFALIRSLFPLIAVVVTACMGAWVLTTWMRIRNGYPLEGNGGEAVYPRRDADAAGRLAALERHNEALRGELAQVRGRLATLERIATDGPARLHGEIEALRLDRAG